MDAELNEETNDSKKKRITHTLGLKAEAPKLADKMRVTAAARQATLHESQIYGFLRN